MLMYALAKAAVQTSVVVCEGAGTVVVSKPELVQGIGGRMNSLFFTTPMKIIRERLHSHGAVLVSDQAKIDQLAGVKKAAALGYHQIAVTVNASMDESFKQLRKIEKNNNLSLVILAICTTGVSRSRLQQIKEYADLTWSCANSDLKAMVGKEAILQISRKIPVFVLTKKGLDFVSAYSDNRQLLNSLNPDKQYLINSEDGSLSFNMARSPVYLKEAKLPVDDSDSPKLTA
jgi:putative methanogenesis marker protein 8